MRPFQRLTVILLLLSLLLTACSAGTPVTLHLPDGTVERVKADSPEALFTMLGRVYTVQPQEGWTAGWYTADGAPVGSNIPDEVFWQTAPMRLKVTLEPRTGDTASVVDAVYGEAYPALTAPQRNGYAFAGWYTAEAGGDCIAADSRCLIPGDHTLYAAWELAEPTPAPAPESEPEDEPAPTVEPEPTAEPEPTDEPAPTKTPAPTSTPKPTNTPAPTSTPKPTSTPAPTGTPKPTSTPTPAAPTVYTVFYSSNGGDGYMTGSDFAVGATHTLSENTYTYEGKTFAGWNTAPDGSGTSYGNKGTIRLTSEDLGGEDCLFLYAMWE